MLCLAGVPCNSNVMKEIIISQLVIYLTRLRAVLMRLWKKEFLVFVKKNSSRSFEKKVSPFWGIFYRLESDKKNFFKTSIF